MPATTPHLLMSDAKNGWAVWPSGGSWLILVTSDGWRTTANATPIAVPTGGGLVVADGGGELVAAVGAYERLTRSPLLTKSESSAQWQPAELPGAVVDDRQAVTVVGGTAFALLSGSVDTVVSGGDSGWTVDTSASDLDPAGVLRLDTITWASESLGWLTGHGPSGTPVAFQTADGGRTWNPIPGTSTGVVAALAPCGKGSSWLLPVIGADGSYALHRTIDGGRVWSAGESLALPRGLPAWGCQGDHVWTTGRSGNSDHVFASADAGTTWSDRGRAPAGLTDLVPETGGAGFAASQQGSTSTLWAVADDGSRFTALSLPAWVATLGADGTSS